MLYEIPNGKQNGNSNRDIISKLVGISMIANNILMLNSVFNKISFLFNE
jgi:hypothetical protein